MTSVACVALAFALVLSGVAAVLPLAAAMDFVDLLAGRGRWL